MVWYSLFRNAVPPIRIRSGRVSMLQWPSGTCGMEKWSHIWAATKKLTLEGQLIATRFLPVQEWEIAQAQAQAQVVVHAAGVASVGLIPKSNCIYFFHIFSHCSFRPFYLTERICMMWHCTWLTNSRRWQKISQQDLTNYHLNGNSEAQLIHLQNHIRIHM